MLFQVKIITSLLLVILLCAIYAMAAPGHSFHKVRIHIPVKHHTHYVTKTKVKTVHIGVPVKVPKKSYWDEDDDDEWTYTRKPTSKFYRRKRLSKVKHGLPKTGPRTRIILPDDE